MNLQLVRQNVDAKPEKEKGRTLKAIKRDWQLYTFMILPLVWITIFSYIPMAGNIIAFRRFNPGGSILGDEWVGFMYFEMFIHDATFWRAFKNTFIIGGLTLLFTFPAPIIFALLLNEVKGQKFKKIVQTISYMPHFLSVVILAGMIIELTSLHGPINNIVEFFGGDRTSFLQQSEWFRSIFVSSRIWQSMGWGAILYLAALTNIDPVLYEAAKVDGANRWQQTINITIPGIYPTIITLLILNVGGIMGVSFEQVLLLYNPLTYATADIISTYLFRVGLVANSFSYATAIGMFEAVIGVTLIATANMISRKLTDTSLW